MQRKLTGPAALDRYYLETRCKIIEIAANLDRIEEGDQAASAKKDRRIQQLRDAITLLLEDKPARAERCQMIFSRPYDATWPKPNAK